MDDSDSGHSAPGQPGEAAGETEALLDRIDTLEGILDGARSKIMRLEGTADQITDDEIGKKVEGLREAIQWWVNAVDQDLRKQGQSFGAGLHRALHDDDNKVSTLRRMGLLDGSGFGTDSQRITWLSGLTTCIYIVLGRHIWSYMQDKVLRLRYPVGVYRDLKDTFDDIVQVMKGDDGAEDQRLLANKWRSDTMRAFIKTPYFQNDRRSFEEEFPGRIIETLTTWIDRETIKRHSGSLTASIIHPAIHLQQQMACSSHEYLIVDPEPSDGARETIPDEPTISSWDLMDMVKWRPAYGEIGGVFRPLYPAIYRRGPVGEDDVLVLQPVVLVYDLADSKTVPGATRLPQPQQDPEKGRDSRPDPQQPPRRSPHPSPERSGQSLSGQPPTPPPDSAKPALPGSIQEEPASISRDDGGRRPSRSLHAGRNPSPPRRVHGKGTARGERPPGDRSSDSTDRHGRRLRRSKTEHSLPSPSRWTKALKGLSPVKTARPQEPNPRPRRSSIPQGSSDKNTAVPGAGGGAQQARVDALLPEPYDGSQGTWDERDRGSGPRRGGSDDDDGSDTFNLYEFDKDGVRRYK